MASLAQFDSKSVLLIILEGISTSLVGHLFYYYSLKFGQVSWVVPSTAAYPLVTVLIAFLFLREGFSLIQLGGAVLTVAGVILVR